ncbi:aldose 1-epimerase family protein [Salibacterium sp. K-3]
MKYSDIDKIGSIHQLAGMERLQKLEGREKGNELIRVRNGNGLSFDVQMDRSMDIGRCECNGVPVAWITPSGFASPSYYDHIGRGWERTFGGGLFTTCGLRTVGKPSDINGEHYGLHGRISHCPGELLEKNGYWNEKTYIQRIKGRMIEVLDLGEVFELKRTIITTSASNEIYIYDKVTNYSYHPQYHAMMYHMNLGYPLLSETTEMNLPSSEIENIKGIAANEDTAQFGAPREGAEPSVDLHHLKNVKDQNSIYISNFIDSIKNRLHMNIKWNTEVMPQWTQWKHLEKGKYVMGVEPGNVSTKGRETLVREGKMPVLEPWESVSYFLKIKLDWEG